MKENSHRLITVSEIARELGVADQTIRNYAKAGIFNYIKLGRRAYIDKTSVDRLMESLRGIDESKRKLEKIKADCDDEIKYYDEMLYRTKEQNSLLYFLLRVPYSRELMTAIFLSVGKGCIPQEKADIVLSLLDGNTIAQVAEKTGRSRGGIMLIVKEAIKQIRSLPTYNSLKEETQKKEEEISILKLTIKNMQCKLSEFEQRCKDIIEDSTFTEDDARMLHLLDTPIKGNFSLSRKAQNCLTWAEIETVGDLVQYSGMDLLKFRGLGKKTLGELEGLLDKLGLSFGMNVSPLMKKYAAYIAEEEKQNMNEN